MTAASGPAFTAVRDIVAGRMPADHALLQNTRLEGFGGRAFGREPILGLFRASPLDLNSGFEVLEGPGALIALGEDTAVFADILDGRVLRLWSLGSEARGLREPSISVARDLDLAQTQGEPAFDPADIPDLAPAHAGPLASFAASFAVPGAGLPPPSLAHVFSCRPFVLRAFSSGDRVGALLVLAGSADSAVRKPFSMNAVVTFRVSAGGMTDERAVVDAAGLAASREAAWTPSF